MRSNISTAANAQPHTQWRYRNHRACRARSTSKPTDVVGLNAEVFGNPDTVTEFIAPLPEDIVQRLSTAVAMIPAVEARCRVLDVGSGTGCLIPHLQARGAVDITAVDLSEAMLGQLQARFPNPSVCGNEPGVRTWCGDFLQLPEYLGSADVICMNAVFGNLPDPRGALLKAALLSKPGGYILVSHPMGREWHKQLHKRSPDIVPHELPAENVLQQLIQGLPLCLVDFKDEPQLYAAVLQVPLGYRIPGNQLVHLDSTVVTGFGRGSKQLGLPTANMDPGPLQQQLQQLPQGVYFGWAQLDPADGSAAVDADIHKMVMNVGRRPTVNTGDEAATVEVHILHQYSQEEFYGSRLRVLAAGFIRPEIRFSGLQQLLARIKADIGIARSQLDDPSYQALRSSDCFRH